MRLRIRSMIGVSFVLVLFILLAYQAQNLKEESELRIKRSHDRKMHDRLKQKGEKNYVDLMSLYVPPAGKPRVSFHHVPLQPSKKENKPLQHTDYLDESVSKQETKLEQDNKRPTNVSANQKKYKLYQANQTANLKAKQFPEIKKPIQRYEHTTKSWSELFQNFKAFQSTEEVEFPTNKSAVPRIPHIIHQIWADNYVIANYSRYIRTFIKHNPKWEYRFWTYESGRRLIAEKHPYLLSRFDNFKIDDIKKVDFIKYTVMYEFGGFYSDIDVKNLRPLDKVTTKYACIIPTEPFEHAALLFKTQMVLNVGIFLCRPKHPFFKLVLQELHAKAIMPDADPLKTTGALHLTFVYMLYNKLSYEDLEKPKTDNSTNTPYFYKGILPEDDDNAIYIPNSQYFMDKVDPTIIGENGIPSDCRFTHIHEFENSLLIPKVVMRGCAEYERRKNVRRNKKYTFTEHYWHHLWSFDKSWLNSLEKLHIRQIVPHYILY